MMFMTDEGFLLLVVEKLNRGLGRRAQESANFHIRDIDFCQWSTHDHCISIFVIVLSFFRSNCFAITCVELSLLHVGWIGTNHVSCWIISSNDISALHTILCCFSSSNTKLCASFPHYLCEMSCSTWSTPAVEVIARVADLIVPGR